MITYRKQNLCKNLIEFSLNVLWCATWYFKNAVYSPYIVWLKSLFVCYVCSAWAGKMSMKQWFSHLQLDLMVRHLHMKQCTAVMQGLFFFSRFVLKRVLGGGHVWTQSLALLDSLTFLRKQIQIYGNLFFFFFFVTFAEFPSTCDPIAVLYGI